MSNTALIRLTNPKYYIRPAQLRSDQGYGIGRTALIKKITITTPNITAIMSINGVPIQLDGLDGKVFDISYIRSILREIIPTNSTENMLCNVESTIFGTQLLAIEYYRYFPENFLFNMLFTGDLCVTFSPTSTNGVLSDNIDIEEEIAISEIQLLQRIAKGETLDDIDKNNKVHGQSVDI